MRLQRVAALLITPVTLVVLLLFLVLLLLFTIWWPASASGAEFTRMCTALLRWLRYLWPLALLARQSIRQTGPYIFALTQLQIGN